ncbi:corticosteroid- binding protein, partial [Lobulomyces angularis]
VLRFSLKSEQEASLLASYLENEELGLVQWSEQNGPHQTDIQFSPQARLKLKDELLSKIENKVWIDDVQSLIDSEAKHAAKNSAKLTQSLSANRNMAVSPETFFSDYQDLETHDAFLGGLPGVQQVLVGTSHQARNVYAYKIGSGAKAVVFHGGIHAREWIGPATVSYIGYHLATDTDEATKKLRSQFTFYVIPVANPDGYAYTRASNGDRMHRKNMQANAGSSCIGTDPNRNFNYKWGTGGSSSNACAQDYKGPRAESAPETAFIQNFVKKVSALSYIDFHAYSQLWMFPWGYSCSAPNSDKTVLAKAGSLAVSALQALYGTRYKHGDICNTIYQASGSSADYTYGAAGVKYSYAVELRDTGN